MLEECQIVTEQSYIYNYIYIFDTFLTLIDILANKQVVKRGKLVTLELESNHRK